MMYWSDVLGSKSCAGSSSPISRSAHRASLHMSRVPGRFLTFLTPTIFRQTGLTFLIARSMARPGYRTRSVLVVPLMEPTGNVIGVFQLINARDARQQIVPFDADYEELIRALASLATVAVRNAQLELARGRASVRFVASLAT